MAKRTARISRLSSNDAEEKRQFQAKGQEEAGDEKDNDQ
jgi:hypothetical protein